jgi:hypothetical protein
MPAANPKLHSRWKQNLKNWHASGLSGAAWCRQEKIAYCVFLYWCKKLEGEPNPVITQPSERFIEISDSSAGESGLTIECQGVTVLLTKGFDTEILKNCLQVIMGLGC